jgi:hypothetical protein
MENPESNILPFEMRREPYTTKEACKVERSFTFVRASHAPVRIEHVVLSVPTVKKP